jgi:hypothetical protein
MPMTPPEALIMANDPHTHHHVRRVVLPSGKTIDVVYFEELDPTALPAAEPRDLHVCPACSSELVYPLDWEEAGPRHWEVTLRCPNCEWVGVDVYDQDTVDRFDEVLDDGTDALVSDLKHLMQVNMQDEVSRFVEALEHDLIVPEDF